jgi:LTXXQ motif family protein
MVVLTFEAALLQTFLRCRVMRKIGAIFGITALAAAVICPLPVAAFGIHLGPLYLHVPFVGHHHRHRLQMRANEARTRPNEVSRGGAARTEQTDRETSVESNTHALGSCTGLMPGVANLPIEQIRQTVHPIEDQEAAFDDLKAASSQASDAIKSSCPSSVPLTPIGRLDAAEQRVDATIKAIEVIRSALARFNDSLSNEQKHRFNAMGGSSERTRSAGDMAAMCGQQVGSFIDLPVKRIEQVVQPTAQQRSTFDDLKKATQNAADQLGSSCPTAVPLSPVARLDTVGTRLRAMADAIKSVRPALENFYASLSDEQKARFNLLGPPPQRG